MVANSVESIIQHWLLEHVYERKIDEDYPMHVRFEHRFCCGECEGLYDTPEQVQKMVHSLALPINQFITRNNAMVAAQYQRGFSPGGSG